MEIGASYFYGGTREIGTKENACANSWLYDVNRGLFRMITYNTRRRQLNRKPEIAVFGAIMDDYGDLFTARCRYTGEIFKAALGVVRGALLPQASAAYLDGPNSQADYKADALAFNEMDKNCNTCRYLRRNGGKSIGGIHYGECLSKPIDHPYPMDGNIIAFAPDDCMNMPCWEAR